MMKYSNVLHIPHKKCTIGTVFHFNLKLIVISHSMYVFTVKDCSVRMQIQ